MTRLPDNVNLLNEAHENGPDETIEERCFAAALVCLEGHYTQSPPMGPQTAAKVSSMITKTLEKTHTIRKAREAISRNVAIWIWLTRIFAAAIPSLTTRSVGPLSSLNDPEKGVTPQESTALIVMNHATIKEDIATLIKLMHIARNLLVNAEPEVPQDICAAVHFDQMVYQTIILCVNVTSKGYDGEILDENQRLKLGDVTELYKKLLVTSLQQAHNWTAKHDRNKMSFWFDVLFDDDGALSGPEESLGDGSGFRPDVAKRQVQHWLDRNSKLCDTARKLLKDYAQNQASRPPGNLAPIRPLAWNWLPDGSVDVPGDVANTEEKINPVWKPDETDKFEQDRAYGRVSREVDTWWLNARDPNYEEWLVLMPSVEFAQSRLEHCRNNLYAHDYVEDIMDEEDADDDESYGEGPLTGLLTEVPNILDPKQIEALHMIVKSCILDNAGSGLTRAGENLQKTRCRMFLALDCGKSLLREMLVFIAVWEKDEQSLIFQVTTQIVEALHHSALIPYAWNSLRIPKDIISPAQTVLLRLVNHMFRARINNSASQETKDNSRDIKLVHFFLSFFRSQNCDPSEFPVDSWDMERAKDGLAQYLDFLTTVAEMLDTRAKLIEWEAIYDLITILTGLEAGVPKKPLIELPKRSPRNDSDGNPMVERPYAAADDGLPPSPPPPPLQEPAHKFPWSGIKGQIFTIIATLLQPPQGQSSPGNPDVQMQMVKYNGIVPLLNCCAYDDHNPYAKERVTICLKWLLDGCEAANNFFRELVNLSPPPNLRPAPGGTTVSTIRVDGIQGEVKVQVRSSTSAPGEQETNDIVDGAGRIDLNRPSGRGSIEDDFMA
ncbi:Copper transport protein 86 [Fusarium oxysporum f. sp. raphani]|uniref:Ataxin-10 homolog n=1 Tax=Fusarium oxysporum f. sp. raphani TaxID=96318 RepID=A0A8J5UM30_FUSOX|nr:Copper transport protein 86 [Fusarium oxysporum f. sp. raphani]